MLKKSKPGAIKVKKAPLKIEHHPDYIEENDKSLVVNINESNKKEKRPISH